MKNIALALCLTFLMAACSSGSSVSDIPPILNGNYSGPYQSNNDENPDRGTMRLNLAQDETDNTISGTFFIEPNSRGGLGSCLSNGRVSGSITGFNVTLTVAQSNELRFTLTASGNTLDGTYLASGDGCSNQSGSGTVTFSR